MAGRWWIARAEAVSELVIFLRHPTQHRFKFELVGHRRQQSGAVRPFSIVVSRIHAPVTPGEPNGSSRSVPLTMSTCRLPHLEQTRGSAISTGST
jgi:hypothetical protein